MAKICFFLTMFSQMVRRYVLLAQLSVWENTSGIFHIRQNENVKYQSILHTIVIDSCCLHKYPTSLRHFAVAWCHIAPEPTRWLSWDSVLTSPKLSPNYCFFHRYLTSMFKTVFRLLISNQITSMARRTHRLIKTWSFWVNVAVETVSTVEMSALTDLFR